MKKIFYLLASLGFTASASLPVVACKKDKHRHKNEGTKDLSKLVQVTFLGHFLEKPLETTILERVNEVNDLNFTAEQIKVTNIDYEISTATLVACAEYQGQVAITFTNKEALLHLLSEAQKELETHPDAADEIRDPLKKAIDYAQNLMQNKDAQQEVVNEGHAILLEALQNFRAALQVVDKAALQDLVTQSHQALENAVNVSEKTLQNLKNALQEAEIVLKNEQATQLQVDVAAEKLNSALIQFRQEQHTTDKKALNSLIIQAESILKINAAAPEAAKKKLETAIIQAQKVRADNNVSQLTVDEMIATLTTAIEVFQQSVLKALKVSLEALVNEAQNALRTGTNVSEATRKNLENAIQKSQKVIINDQAKQTDFERALRELTSALLQFQTENKPSDKSVLIKLIQAAEKALETNPIASQLQKKAFVFMLNNARSILETHPQAPESARERLQAAINKAQKVRDDEQVSQKVVDNAVHTLTIALDEFSKELIKLAKNELEILVTVATKNLESAVNVSLPTIAALEGVLAGAKVVIDDSEATLEVVQKIYRKLTQTLEKFNAENVKTDKNALRTLVTKAQQALQDALNVSSATIAILEAAIIEAQNILKKESVSQIQVDATYQALAAVFAAFELENVATDKKELQKLVAAVQEALRGEIPNVSAATLKNLKASQKNAQDLLNNPRAAQVQVNEKLQELKVAFDQFKLENVKTTKEALTALVKNAQEVLAKGGLNVSESITKALELAIQNAQRVLTDPQVSQVNVDKEFKKLTTALENFRKEDKSTDKVQLHELILEAKQQLTGVINAGSETVAALKHALNEAEKIFNDEKVSQTKVNQTYQHLNQTLNRFKLENLPTNKENLKQLFEEAQTALAEKGPNVSAKTTQLLMSALEKTQSILADPQATQLQVNENYHELSTVLTQFHQENVKTNKDKLNHLLSEAQTALAEKGPNVSAKTTQLLMSALEKTQSILADPQATQLQVNENYHELSTVLTQFHQENVKTDKTNLQNLYDKAQNVFKRGGVNVSASTLKALETALDQTKEVLENEKATREQVATSYQKLSAVLWDFQNENVPTNKEALRDLIFEAQELLKNNSHAPANIRRNLETILHQSKVINDKLRASQIEVDSIAKKLTIEIGQFKTALIGISKTNLMNLIAQAEAALHEGINVSLSTQAELKAVLAKAQAIIKESHPSLTKMNATYQELTQILDQFNKENVPTDKTSLQLLLNDAQAALEKALNATPSTIEKLKKAISDTKGVLNDPKVSQKVVDTVYRELTLILTQFNSENVQTNKSKLRTLLKSAEEALKNAPNVSLVTRKELEKTIRETREVLNNSWISQVEVDKNYQKLNWILTKFESENVPTSKTKLANLIKEAEEALRSGGANVSKKTREALKDSISEGKILLNNPQVSQTDVDNHCNQLNTFLEKFRSEDQKTNKAILEALVKEAQELIANNPEASASTRRNLETILNNGKRILEDLSASQEIVNYTAQQLKTGIEKFKENLLKESKIALNRLICDGEKVLNNNRNAARWARRNLENILEEARQVRDSHRVSQLEINQAIANLKVALNQFQEIVRLHPIIEAIAQEAKEILVNNPNKPAAIRKLFKDLIDECASLLEKHDLNAEDVKRLEQHFADAKEKLINSDDEDPDDSRNILRSQIKEAERLLRCHPHHPKASTLREAIASAKKVANNPHATNQEISEAQVYLLKIMVEFQH